MPLTLYHLPRCPYCRKVRRRAAALGVGLQLVDISSEPAAARLLMGTLGRTTVPVLDTGTGLLPESDDIIAFLEENAASLRRAA